MNMGRRLMSVWVVLLLASLGLTGAVSASPGGLTYGFKGGVNIGSCGGFESFFDPQEWDPLPSVSKGSRVGGVVGGFVTYWLGDRIAVQPELLYAQAGCTRDFSEIEIEGVLGELANTAAVDYVEIPILLEYFFMGRETSSPFICAGPSIGIKTGAELEMEATVEMLGVSQTMTFTEDIGDYIKSTNFSLAFGGGYVLKLSTITLIAEARYTLGLVDVMEEKGRVEVDGDEYIQLDEAKPRTISITAGVAFR